MYSSVVICGAWYGAPTEAAALVALGELEAAWGKSHPAVISFVAQQLGARPPFFAFPHEVRRIIYTTNAIESLNYSLVQDHQVQRALPQ